MKQVVRIVVLAGMAFSMVACTSLNGPKQRSYIEAALLDENTSTLSALDEEKGKTLKREVVASDYTLTAFPLRTAELKGIVDKLAYQKKASPADQAKMLSDFKKIYADKTCFSVAITGRGASPTDFNHIYFTFEGADGKLVDMKPLLPYDLPTKSTKVGSYTTGGYSYNIGNTTYISPSTTNVYSYEIYNNDAIVCAAGAHPLAKGFSLYVDNRHKEGLPIEDLVWSTNPEDKTTYANYPGTPSSSNGTYWSDSATASAEWQKARRALVQKKLKAAE